MRYAFVKALISEAEKNSKIVLLTGDLGFTVLEPFKNKFPERFINVGVAEQNMMSIAAGLALSGKIVFAYSIATFAVMRAFEQIRNDIAAHNASVIVVGIGAGFCYGYAGTSHYALEDINLMRVVPGMTILCPADPIEADWATHLSAKLKSPVYLRLGKSGESIIYKKRPRFYLAKGHFLRKGKDLAILATGNIVFSSLEAAEILSKKNIQASVISMHTLKPIDSLLVRKCARQFPILTTIEEHSLIGGLGTSVAEILAEEKTKAKFLKLGASDKFLVKTGSQNYLREKMGLTPQKIADKIFSVFKS